MSEEGEIPQHLQESVPSAEAYMAAARREFQIATKAWELRIPGESLANSTVHHYVGVLRDLKTAFAQLEWPEDDVWPADSPLHESESQVAGLYNCARAILEDGLAGRRLDLADLRHGLDNLARRYGRTVGHVDPHHPVPEVPAARGPLWSGRSRDEPDPYGQPPWPGAWSEERGGWWTDVNPPGYERQDREYEASLKAEAARQGLPEELPEIDAVTRVLLARLLSARQLLAATATVSGLPEAPGLTPTASERLTRVAPLARLAVGVLEEELHPGRLSPSRVTGELNEVGRAYGLKIQ